MRVMCEHCGCRGVAPIAQLMDEHFELLELSGVIRGRLEAGDRDGAWRALGHLAEHLVDHVRREEAGVFRALREQGEYAEAVGELEEEHRTFDELLSELDLGDAELAERVGSLLDELSVHIDKENLGVFPVAVVTLGARGWETVAAAHGRPGMGAA
jgi:hemerythrin-like domain-containing protein